MKQLSFRSSLLLTALCGSLSLGALGCGASSDEVDRDLAEIVDNLEQAGFPSDDIMIQDGQVYVGRDAVVTLAASREMLSASGSTEEQYRTNNLVSAAITKICINAPAYTGNYGTALDLAIQNYNEQGLRFTMARAPSSGCSFTINAFIQPGGAGGVAGFPSGGLPYSQFTIFDGIAPYGVDVIEHVITHELGHTIGFRHSDYFNRSISCGSGGNEGDAGVGAVLIPGTPSGAAVGASIMNSCFRASENGELTGTDITALRALYPRTNLPTPNPPTTCGNMVAGQSLGVGNALYSCDGRFQLILQGDGNLVLYKIGVRALWSSGTYGQSSHYAYMQPDGHFVLYNTALQPTWYSGTNGNPGAYLALQNDGNLVIYRNGVALWNTGTHGN
jgi:Dual-action HEIGH metallo-peptidase